MTLWPGRRNGGGAHGFRQAIGLQDLDAERLDLVSDLESKREPPVIS